MTEIAADVRVDASALSRVGRGRTHHRTVREAIDSSYRDLPRPLAALHRAVGAVPGPFTAELAAGLVAADVTNAVAGLAHRSLLTPLGPARSGGASRFAQLATVRGHANHLAERAGEDPAGPRNAWVARLVCARPALGSARHVGWYGALDDDLAALRATLQHTLVEAPSATGVAVAARLAVYWGFRGMAREGERWMRTAVDACAADPELGRRAERAAVHVDLGTCWTVQGRPAEGCAWLAAANAARLLLAGGRAAEALTWSRAAVRTSVEAGLRDNAYVLEVHGAALGRAGEAAAALRVFGAVEAQHRGAGVPWPWDESVGALLTAMTARLGRAAAERAREEGARATLAELADT